MKKIIKRPLSVLLAALMIVSVFVAVPVTANAASPGDHSGGSIVVDPVVVTIGSEFATAPTAISGLVANGTDQALINEGTTSAGTAYYYMTTEDITGEQANSLFNSPSKPGSFSTSIPKGTDAGTYYVWYAIDGGSNYEDLLPYMEINNTHITNKLTVTIAAPEYYIVGIGGDWDTLKDEYKLTKNPNNDAEYMFEGLTVDANTELKVKGTNTYYYPNGTGNNFTLVDAGTYDIYFRPDGQGGEGWWYGDIYATPSAPAPTYTVTWKNGDSVIETDTGVAAGTTPTYNGETPTKTSDNYYDYTFSGWSDGSNTYAADALPAVSGDVTYTAQYTATFKGITSDELYKGLVLDEGTALKFMLMKSGERWQNGYLQVYLDDVLVKDLTVEGGPTTEPDRYYTTTKKCIVDSYEKYSNAHFIHFKSVYDVTWKNDDGTVLEKDENVVVGTTPTYDGTTPEKAEDEKYTYTFAGWSPEITAVTGDVTYTAQYTATFKGITSDELYKGLVIDAGTPIKFMIIKSGEDWRRVDLSVYLDGTLVKDLYTQYVSKTEPDRYYTTTKKCIVDSYEFSRGDPSRHVLYLKSVYDVTWKNYDGTELEKDENVVVGTTPTYNGTTPEKAEDANNTYTFAGWSPAIAPVTEDVTYTATFTAVPKGINYGGDNYIDPKGTQAVIDENNFGLNLSNYLNMQILGIQLKNSIATEGGADGVRFVTAVNSNLLKGSNIEDYGYIVAKINANVEDLNTNMDKFTADKFEKDINVFSCKGTSNSISGDFGQYSTETDYKYVTLAVTGTSEQSGNLIARFYVKTKDGKYHYADYINGNSETNSGMAFDLTAVSANLG